MCSISGIYLKSPGQVTQQDLERLSLPLAHRGPDGSGHYIHQHVGLFHYRLAINDLSTTAAQPFFSNQHTASIANGEIYNTDALRQRLANDHIDINWQSHSDCEVIPHLYDHFGMQFTTHLRGMYSIAIYDQTNQRLILARDPYGMKQLYYAETKDGVYFASEPSAIAHYFKIKKPNLNTLIAVGDIHFSPDEQTGFNHIQRVLPGETIIIENGKIIKRHLHRPPTEKKQTHSASQFIKQFDQVFEETIDKHLLSDVPIGLFLSGGIDSTCLLTMLSRFKQTPVHTFTIGFDSKETHNECDTARRLAQHFHTDHMEITFSEDDFWHYLPQAIMASDDPTADYAIVPTFKLAEAAKDLTPVVLSGEGGDELFAGYGRYRHFMAPFWRRKKMYRKGAISSLNLFKPSLNAITWQHTLATLTNTLKMQSSTRLDLAQHIDQATWLPNDLLIKLDRMLMWHSLEGRTPFLDNDMYRFASTLPDNMKMHKHQGKWMLRCWLNEQLDHYDPFTKKKGFSVPIRDWLDRRRQTLATYLLTHPFIIDHIHTDRLKQILSTPLDKKTAMATWGLLYITGWYDTHILDTPLSV